MIQYVLTYYPNVGASKRETANGGTQPRSPAAAGGALGLGRAGAAAGRRGNAPGAGPQPRARLFSHLDP
jgi:hypothetical protein